MKARMAALQQAWLARTGRERAILCLAAMALPLLVADTLLWNPWRLQMKAVEARSAQATQELQRLQQAGAAAPTRQAEGQQQLQALRQRLHAAQEAVAQARQQVVMPSQMAATLRAVTEAHGPVQVLGLRSLPVTPVLEGSAGAEATALAGARAPTAQAGGTAASSASGKAAAAVAQAGQPRLYRHSFELQLQGSYADIARYVQHLEQHAGVLRWSVLELDAEQHPAIQARLEVFTLSEQAQWIQL